MLVSGTGMSRLFGRTIDFVSRRSMMRPTVRVAFHAVLREQARVELQLPVPSAERMENSLKDRFESGFLLNTGEFLPSATVYERHLLTPVPFPGRP